MPRPRKCRHIGFYPHNTKFMPEKGYEEEVILTFEEVESLRLCDLNEMDQFTAADSMNVSRGTLQRILNQARKKVADAVTNGKMIRIAQCECGKDDCECHKYSPNESPNKNRCQEKHCMMNHHENHCQMHNKPLDKE